MQYAWFIWSLILLAIWLAVYLLLKSRENRKEMLVVGLWTSLLGLTEPLFVPAYWNPPSLFDLAVRTGFDIESLIFAFGIGGLAVVAYEWMFRARHRAMSHQERHAVRHRYHLAALLVAPAILIALLLVTEWNPIYASVIALMTGGFATWYCRPDLKRKMFASAFIFLGLYFLYFLTLTAMYPGYVEQVWNLGAISGILFVGIPLEELMFAFSFGFFWSSIYEHVAWRKLRAVTL